MRGVKYNRSVGSRARALVSLGVAYFRSGFDRKRGPMRGTL
jgi:hypothetical protein